ncbi:hypothetical protein [Streptomyces zhihengii]|uniref:hypothetical protein n=1 Tax=Streptomyces zhihengii TaxID=1818004 RepID=UPI0033BEE834
MQAMVASGRYSDATPLDAATLGTAVEEFLDQSWHRFLPVLDHAPTLLNECRPALSPWPKDAATLSRLTDAVLQTGAVLEGVFQNSVAPQERRGQVWPAVQTWLTDGGRFLRQARLSAPHRRPVLPATAPARSLTAGARPAPHAH